MIDPLAEKYYPLSPYNYVANNPLKYIDIDGRKIGEPDGPDAQRMSQVLNKTETGKAIWNAMVQSERTIYIHYATGDGGELADNIRGHLRASGAMGEVVSSVMYEKISKGEELTAEDFEASWSKNEETGEYEKTEAWDETHILIDDVALMLDANMISVMNGYDMDKAKDLAEIYISGEEAVHSTQDTMDPENTYEERKHEKEAKKTKQDMKTEYLDQ